MTFIEQKVTQMIVIYYYQGEQYWEHLKVLPSNYYAQILLHSEGFAICVNVIYQGVLPFGRLCYIRFWSIGNFKTLQYKIKTFYNFELINKLSYENL